MNLSPTLKDDTVVQHSADMILACKFPIYQGETGFFIDNYLPAIFFCSSSDDLVRMTEKQLILPKGICNRLVLIKCYLVDINLIL